jgi:hypothetical protein
LANRPNERACFAEKMHDDDDDDDDRLPPPR